MFAIPNFTHGEKYADYYFLHSLNIHKLIRVQICNWVLKQSDSCDEEMHRQYISDISSVSTWSSSYTMLVR